MSDYADQNIPFMLVLDERIRRDLLELIRRNDYNPTVLASVEESIDTLKGRSESILFLDGEAVRVYGVGIFSKAKVASRGCRIILLCDQAHRDLVKEAMQLGAYCCILEPFAEWEVLTILKHILADMQPRKRKAGRKIEESPAKRSPARRGP